MNEDQLKETWCPHVRRLVVTGISVTAVNHPSDPHGDLCLGRRCSQFREHVVETAIVPSGKNFENSHPHAQGWRIVRSIGPSAAADWTLELERVRGVYCGLAGRP